MIDGHKRIMQMSPRPMTTGDGPRIAWKLPKTIELMDRANVERNRFGNIPGVRGCGKMFICPPVAENIHQLLEEKRLHEKKDALNAFLQ